MRAFFLTFAFLGLMATQSVALEAESFVLENGMKVVLVEDHRAPVVVHSVWYRAGSADEPTGKTGIAHMLEHMMFKGTKEIPPGQFSKIIAKNGGRDNAFTSRDYTAYYQKIAKEKLEIAMRMEADRMANLNISDEEFQPERDVVLEERRWRVESQPIRQFFEELQKEYMPTHPYGNPVIGWKKDIEGYTLQDALDWYRTFYGPNNATLIMVGDITRADVEPLIHKYYGSIKPTSVKHPEWKAEPVRGEALRFTKADAEVKVPVFYRLYRAPSAFSQIGWGSYHEEGDANWAGMRKEALKLALLAEILGGGQTGRLYQKLVKELGVANSASINYSSVARAENSFDFYIQPKEGVTLLEIEKVLDEEIEGFITKAISEEELARAKTQFLADNIYARDDLFNTVYRLGVWLMAGGKVENFDAWQEDIKHITPSDLQDVARRYLDINRSTTGLLVGSESQLN